MEFDVSETAVRLVNTLNKRQMAALLALYYDDDSRKWHNLHSMVYGKGGFRIEYKEPGYHRSKKHHRS